MLRVVNGVLVVTSARGGQQPNKGPSTGAPRVVGVHDIRRRGVDEGWWINGFVHSTAVKQSGASRRSAGSPPPSSEVLRLIRAR